MSNLLLAYLIGCIIHCFIHMWAHHRGVDIPIPVMLLGIVFWPLVLVYIPFLIRGR